MPNKTPELLLGNEAIAHAALEAGLSFFACYPGTPSSEVAEALILYKNSEKAANPEELHIEYSINEKVALEAACGAALAGAASMAAMKHVGMNVAADPLFTAAYIGMPGGLVILSADDPGCHSSQNEQDNRHYARAAHIPCFEPASPGEAREMTLAAFALAKRLKQPVMLRTTTRVNHSRGAVCPGPIEKQAHEILRPEAMQCVPVPFVARKRRRILAQNMEAAKDFAENSAFNILRVPENNPGKKGIMASGMGRAYLHDALLELGMENDFAMLELGMTWPLPEQKIRRLIDACEEILVFEEGDPLLESAARAIAQGSAKIYGKDQNLTPIGEYSTQLVKNRLQAWLRLPLTGLPPGKTEIPLPGRPPNLCPGCAHRSVYYAAKKVFSDQAVYSSDIGCYTLGLLPPLSAADFAICMGSSLSAGSGYSNAAKKTVVAFIGDSTFFHSGLTGLANAVFNKHDLIAVILDNGTTAMTGHQPNPGMNQEAMGDNARQLNLEAIISSLGVDFCKTVTSHNLQALLRAFEEASQTKGVRVVIAKEPCLLFAQHKLGKKRKIVAEVKNQCPEGEKCVAELACPAFTRKDGALAINPDLCGGCAFCIQIAPNAFRARKLSS